MIHTEFQNQKFSITYSASQTKNICKVWSDKTDKNSKQNKNKKHNLQFITLCSWHICDLETQPRWPNMVWINGP